MPLDDCMLIFYLERVIYFIIYRFDNEVFLQTMSCSLNIVLVSKIHKKLSYPRETTRPAVSVEKFHLKRLGVRNGIAGR